MRSTFLLIQIAFIFLLFIGAKTHVSRSPQEENKEIKFLKLKLKKELSDKRLSAHKKYTLAILAARDFRRINLLKESLDFYKIANEIKIDENKNEIRQAFSKRQNQNTSLFFYEVNFKTLLKNKSYERALLSMNPEKLNGPQNGSYKIIYDLLNVKIKKRSVQKLYCFDEYQKNPEDYQYSNLLCELLVDYLRDGKIRNDQIKVIEEYFLMHDLKDRYLLQIAKDLKGL